MMRNMIRSVLVSASLAAVVACGSDKPAQEPSAMTPPPPAPMPESKPATTDAKPIEGTMGGGPSADTTTTAPKPPTTEKPMTDGEIEMAQLATKSATNADVKNFAAMMVTQHRDMETKGKTLAAKAKITPAENDASKSLKSDVDSSLATMKGQKGKDFDKAYIDAQVKAHRDVLNMIDNKLLPSAQNGDLKTMLTDARTHVATHLAKAEEIQQKLESAPAKPTTPAKPAPKK
jgi:putative membrane protein